MIALKTSDNQILTLGISNISPPIKESRKIKNTLLDGSYHIQTIGNPLEKYTFRMLCNQEQVEYINEAEATAEMLILQIKNNEKIGFIDNQISWERITNFRDNETLYIGSCDFVIAGEEE